MQRLYTRILAIGLFSAAALMISCGEAPKGDDAIRNTDETITEDGNELNEKAEQVKHIFRAVPSPMEMASMLKVSGAQYDAKLLNDVRNVNSYNTARSQALNIGVYGANLSYTSVFNQNQESIIYLSCTKKLADKLGVSAAFDDEIIERLETNIDNRDSLLNIVSETYYLLDAYLKENMRDHVSAMVIAAGWVEGLYISTTVATSSTFPSEELLARIGDQKISLKNLRELVDAYNADGQVDEIAEDLATIQNVFDEYVSLDKGQAKVAKDKDGSNLIGAPISSSIKPGGLEKIHETVSEIRSRYIS